MKPDSRVRRSYSWIGVVSNRLAFASVFLLLLLCLGAAARLQDALSLGKVSLAYRPTSGPLNVRASRASFGSLAFLARVGGVAFIETAAPSPTLGSQRVRLAYDAARPDGSRLAVTVGNSTYYPRIADWQLVPIARFAARSDNSAVSLFGKNSTKTHYEAVYHPDFQNTLLGLRLLQADMMLLLDIEDAAQLPRRGANPILGAGEGLPNQATAYPAAVSVHSVLEGHKLRSWVLTDRGETIRFGVNDGNFQISGEPYYYFWTHSRRSQSIADSIQLLGTRHNENVHRFNTLLYQIGNRTPSSAQLAQLGRYEAALRRDSISMSRLERELDRSGAAPVPAATAALKARRQAIRAYNPAVYDAARQTMRYAAFFRWVR